MNYSELYAKQIELEKWMFDGGVSRYYTSEERSIKAGSASDAPSLRKLVKELITPLSGGIQAYKEHYNNRRGTQATAIRYLNCVPNEILAYITLKIAVDCSHIDVTMNSIAIMLGEKIEDQLRFSKLEGQNKKYFAKVTRALLKNSTASYRHKHRVYVSSEKRLSDTVNAQNSELALEGRYEDDPDYQTFKRWLPFPKTDLGHIGFTLLQILEESLSFKDEPVFYRETILRAKSTEHKLKLSPFINEWAQIHSDMLSEVSPIFAPCIIPPLDWSNCYNGGFHTEAVRSTTKMVGNCTRSHLKRLNIKQMPLYYEAINWLQQVEWQVNTDVLAIAEEVMLSDLGLAMPTFSPIISKDKRPVSPVPYEFQHLRGDDLKSALSEDEYLSFIEWKRELSALYTEESKRSSKAFSTQRQIQLARKYSIYNSIYFVYYGDSRSRIYCLSSILHPQSDDIGKSLLRASKGEPMNDYYEFCITGANLFGHDKEQEDVKVSRVNEPDFIDMCHDIATDALTFIEWIYADAPWQFLAWALEFSHYHQLKDAGRESEFITKIPNGRDGSCSGIQHYSAMMLDEVGGALVNLVPSNVHQDIYKGVALESISLLDTIIKGDVLEFGSNAEGEDKIPHYLQVEFAEMWKEIGITRGLTKNPVMTLPYGSSISTCREAVEGFLLDLETEEKARAKISGRAINPVHPFTKRGVYSINDAITFMTRVIWSSITVVVKAPVIAMKFIKSISKKVCALNMGLEHTTPTGFIVEQKIYETESTRVYTKMLGMSSFTVLEETDKIDYYGMSGASAPNFIHSMDASHLVLTVVAMKRLGIKFVHVIHDDFGTLCGRVKEMQYSLRNEMRLMYKGTNKLEEYMLENEFRLGVDFELEVPEQYDLDLDLLMNSKSAFA